MKNAKAIKGQKALAMAVVAMFALCAFTVCIGSESDAGVYGGATIVSSGTDRNQIFTIDASVDQTFTYTEITTNLSNLTGGSVTISGALSGGAEDKTNLTYNDTSKTVSGKFLKSGSFEFVLTAIWEDAGKNVEQTATQTLKFNVKEKVAIGPENVAGYAIKDKTDYQSISMAYSGPIENDVTVDLGDGKDLFDYDLTSTTLTLIPKGAFSEVKTHNFTVTITNPSSTDSDKVDVTYTVFKDIAIENSGLTKYTYEGDEDGSGSHTFTVNYDTDADANTVVDSKNITLTPSSNTPMSAESNSYTVSYDTTEDTAGKYTGDNEISKTFTAEIKVDGHVGNTTEDGAVTTSTSATGTYTLVVYKALNFTKMPTNDSSIISNPTSSKASIALSAYITGATSVVFNWGDGTQTATMDNGGKVQNTYSAYHSYAKEGLYTIMITSTNAMGTTTSQVLYNVGEGDMNFDTDKTTDDTDKTTTEKEKSFIDKHGVQFIVFGILCILALVAFFYFGYQSPYVIIAAIILAALAVLCFVYHDISGIIDAFRK